MPTEKEIKAARLAVMKCTFRAEDSCSYSAERFGRAALEAAEKVRAEATTKQEEKLREALESEVAFREVCRNADPQIEECPDWNKVDKLSEQALQTEEKGHVRVE